MKISQMVVLHLEEITFYLVKEFIKLIRTNQHQPILLLINSLGGSVEDGLKLIRAIRKHGQVTGLVTGDCHSIVVLILQSCQQRLILPKSTLFFHSIAVNDVKVLDCVNGKKNEIDKAYQFQIDIEKMIAKRSHQKPSLIRAFCEKETTLCAKEALEFGFVDQIFNFSIPNSFPSAE